MTRPPLLTAAGPCLLWSGLLVGGSVAAVSKFRAPGVSRDALVRVGKAQFTALRRVEAALAAAAVGLNAAAPAPAAAVAPIGVAVAAAVLQAGVVVPWVRREAEERAAADGEDDGKGQVKKAMSGAHGVSIALELVKLGTCLYASFVAS